MIARLSHILHERQICAPEFSVPMHRCYHDAGKGEIVQLFHYVGNVARKRAAPTSRQDGSVPHIGGDDEPATPGACDVHQPVGIFQGSRPHYDIAGTVCE